jgi:hypothetical protein
MFRLDEGRMMTNISLSRQFHNLKKGRKKIRNSFTFLYNLWQSGKIVEAISFGYWEVRFYFFAPKLVCFTNDMPLKPNISWDNVSKNLNSHYPLKISRSSYNWKVLYFDSSGTGFGSQYDSPRDLYHMPLSGKANKLFHFSEEVLSIFVSSKNIILVSLGNGSIYRSSNGGLEFSISLSLSTHESSFRLDYGITETPDNQLIIGEYGNVANGRKWKAIAYLYFSNDEGKSWKSSDFLLSKGVNKHVHIVKYSKRINSIILTDGDNKKQIWKGCPLNNESVEWKLINKFHIQTGGYTSMVEIDDKFLFGTDYYGGTNFIVESNDCERYIKSALPKPYKRCPIFSMVKRSSDGVDEIWASLHNSTSSTTKSLLMFTRDNAKSWVKVIEYDGAKNRIHIVSAARGALNVIYFCVTSLSKSGPEIPLGTFSISDET